MACAHLVMAVQAQGKKVLKSLCREFVCEWRGMFEN